MKWLFLLLLAANLVFAAWGQFGRQREPNPLARQEIHAEKIRIVPPLPVSAPLPVSEPVAASSPAASSLACYKWGRFSKEDAEAATKAVKSLDPAARVRLQELSKPQALGFWVYIPPAKTKSAALDAIRKLNAMGIRDHFLIQESGKWQHAISLGVFKTGEAAKRYAATMRSRGVAEAVSGMRGETEIMLWIENLSDAAAGRLKSGNAAPEATDCKTIPGKASRD